MKFNCAACRKAFDETEVVCEDWRDPMRSFICPHCLTPLRKESNTPHIKRTFGPAFLLLFALSLPAAFAKTIFTRPALGALGVFAMLGIFLFFKKFGLLPKKGSNPFRNTEVL